MPCLLVVSIFVFFFEGIYTVYDYVILVIVIVHRYVVRFSISS